MSRFIFGLLIVLLSASLTSGGQPAVQKEERILVILDASVHMNDSWLDGHSKYQTAAYIIEQLMEEMYQVDPEVAFGLRVYGHRTLLKNACNDSRLEVAFSKDNRVQTGLRLAALAPGGEAAISYAAAEAVNDLVRPQLYNYTLLYITSGGAYCDDDFCTKAARLAALAPDASFVFQISNDGSVKTGYACAGTLFMINSNYAIEAGIAQICNRYRRSALARNNQAGAVLEGIPPRPVAVAPAIQSEAVSPPADTIPSTASPAETVHSEVNKTQTYLLLKSRFSISGIELRFQPQQNAAYVPAALQPVLPMPEKQALPSGRYRIFYTRTEHNTSTQRIKEFFLREDMDNEVWLD